MPDSGAESGGPTTGGGDVTDSTSGGDYLDELGQAVVSKPRAADDKWEQLDVELTERLDVDESTPASWGDRVALEPGEKFMGYFRGITPNPAADRPDVILLETSEREPVFHYGTRMLLGELEKSCAKPGDMVAIGRRLEDGKGSLGAYAYFRVRCRPVDDDI
jgi:hypothetical protein